MIKLFDGREVCVALLPNYIEDYKAGIAAGRERVNKFITKLIAYIDEGLEKGLFVYDKYKAFRAIYWIEHFCHHNKGKWAPGLLKLEPFQKFATAALFGLVDEDGFRHHTEVAFFMGRKCGKTLLGSAWLQYMAFGQGEYGAEIYTIAPKLEQSAYLYDAAMYSIDHEPSLAARAEYKKKGRFIPETNSWMMKLPFSEKKSDGGNPFCTGADEVGAWEGERGLRQWEVMLSGGGARDEPLTFAISSGGYADEGLYDELFARGTQILNGTSEDTSLLPIFYQIDDRDKWDDVEEIRKALPCLGVSVSYKYIEREIKKAHQSVSKKMEFLTKYDCVKVSAKSAWLDRNTLRTVFGDEKITLADCAGAYGCLGTDLSKTVDLSTACLVVDLRGKTYFFVHFFMPRNKLEVRTEEDGIPYEKYVSAGWLTLSGENRIDYHDIERWMERIRKEYRIKILHTGYDAYSAAYFVDSLEAKGFSPESVRQGYNLTGVIYDVEGMMKDGTLVSAEDNDLMKLHLIDTALKPEGNDSERVKIEKVSRKVHIDGTAALLDAMTMRYNYIANEGRLLRNEAIK